MLRTQWREFRDRGGPVGVCRSNARFLIANLKRLCPPLIPVPRPPVQCLDLQRFRSRAGWTLFQSVLSDSLCFFPDKSRGSILCTWLAGSIPCFAGWSPG